MTSQDPHSARCTTVQDFLRDVEKLIERHKIEKTCLGCEHMSAAAETSDNIKDALCTLYNAVPPAKVIVRGCPAYIAAIPF